MYDTVDEYRVVKVSVSLFLPRGTGTKPSQHFPVPTSCLASISLAPTGNYLAIWEGSLEVNFIHAPTTVHTLILSDSISYLYTPYQARFKVRSAQQRTLDLGSAMSPGTPLVLI